MEARTLTLSEDGIAVLLRLAKGIEILAEQLQLSRDQNAQPGIPDFIPEDRRQFFEPAMIPAAPAQQAPTYTPAFTPAQPQAPAFIPAQQTTLPLRQVQTPAFNPAQQPPTFTPAPQQQPQAPIYNQFPQQPPVNYPAQQPQASVIPTVAPAAYTLEQLALAATPLVDAGRRADLVGLLTLFGVAALTQLPKEQYGAFATELRALGAKI